MSGALKKLGNGNTRSRRLVLSKGLAQFQAEFDRAADGKEYQGGCITDHNVAFVSGSVILIRCSFS